MTVIYVTLVAIVVATLATTAAYLWKAGFFHNPFDDAVFDGAAWMSAVTDESAQNVRGPMAEDVQRRFLRTGMRRSDVGKLLGDPTDSQGTVGSSGEDRYALGFWGNWTIEGDYLVVRYGDDGRVTGSEIWSH